MGLLTDYVLGKEKKRNQGGDGGGGSMVGSQRPASAGGGSWDSDPINSDPTQTKRAASGRGDDSSQLGGLVGYGIRAAKKRLGKSRD